MSLDTQLQSAFTAVGNAMKNKISASEKGAANGVATLDGTGKIPSAQIPGAYDDVLEYASLAALPVTGVSGIIYIDISNGKQYRWSGTAYASTGGGAVDSVQGRTGAVMISKSDIGLSNLDNTSDINKPISNSTQSALDLKASAAALTTLTNNVGATDTNFVSVFNAALV